MPSDRSAPRLTVRTASLAALIALAACATPTTARRKPPRLALEDRPLPTLGSDLGSIPSSLGSDFGAVFGSGDNWLLLGAGGVAALVTEQPGIEDRLEALREKGEYLDDRAGAALDLAGTGLFLFTLTGIEYGIARATEDAELLAASKQTLRALSVTGLTTLVMKAVISDARPDTGVTNGFPSGHSSMSMAFAVSVDESFGHAWGIPAYLASGAIGLQRLDSGRHDLDDVVFGWTLGFVVARTIFDDQEAEPERVLSIGPFVDPSRDLFGLRLRASF